MDMNEAIPEEVGRNLSPDEAKTLALAGPPCVKPDTQPCSGGEKKCVNGDSYTCGSGGWFRDGGKC